MEILETETNIGLIREKNEDVGLTIKHKKDHNIKLLIVADGMGGKSYGAAAASYAVASISKWFQNKDLAILNNTKKVEELLTRFIKIISTNLIKEYGENVLGTTLTLAIINNKETIIFNVGDSRAYTYKNSKLTQVTEDDSDVWMYYKYGEVKKDDLRYFANNNIITACVGLYQELCKVKTTIIKNDYELLLLVTDGITDMITDKKIQQIIKKSKKEEIIKNIVNEAVNIDQKLKIPLYLKRKNYAKYVTPFKGRDNATASIYIK